MISKKEFCYLFERLRDYEEKCDKVNDDIEKLFGEYSFIGYDIPHISIIFNLLRDIFNLDKTDDIIEEWFYDAIEMELEDNGVKYYITDAASLYDYLIDTYDIKVKE